MNTTTNFKKTTRLAVCLTALLCVTQLTGCFYQVTTQGDIERALFFCKDKLGIDEIIVIFDGNERVYCANGEESSTKKIKILSDT